MPQLLVGTRRRLLAISAAANVAFPPSERGRHSVAYFRSSIIQPASTSVYASLCFLAEPQAKVDQHGLYVQARRGYFAPKATNRKQSGATADDRKN